MKARHHFSSSLVVGGALYWVTGSSFALAGTMIGGFLIDADHVIDQLWSIRHGAPHAGQQKAGPADDSRQSRGKRWLARYVRRRRLIRLPLVFHSFELMTLLAILAASLQTPFLIGLLTGYVLHLTLDLIKHHHEFRSPLFYLLSYRWTQGFRRDRLIKPEYL